MLTRTHETNLKPAPVKTLGQRRLKGVLNRSGMRYKINLNWHDTRLIGRFGGWLLGKNVQLERTGDDLLGTVSSGPFSGGTIRLAVHARFSPDEHDPHTGRLELRLTGLRRISTATMTIHTDCITGTVRADDDADHGRSEIRLKFRANGLEGQIGVDGQHVCLERTETPDETPNFVLVTAALLVDAVTREVSRALLESLDRMREI
jgi:hypothetical protein